MPLPAPFSERSTILFALARDALAHAVRRLSRPGATWLVPAWTCEVVPRVIRAAGGSPAYYEVDEMGHPRAREVIDAISARPGGVVIVHPFGVPARGFAEILEAARRADVPLIEDCALASFSRDGDAYLGARGDAAIFSLRKSLPIRSGAALLANTPRARELLLIDPPRMRPARRIRGAMRNAWRSLLARAGPASVRRRAILSALDPDLRPIDRVPEAIDPEAVKTLMALDSAAWRESRIERYTRLWRAVRGHLDLEPLLPERLSPGVLPFALPVKSEDPRAMAERLRLSNVPCGLWPDMEPSPAELAPMRPRGPMFLLRIPPPTLPVDEMIARARGAIRP